MPDMQLDAPEEKQRLKVRRSGAGLSRTHRLRQSAQRLRYSFVPVLSMVMLTVLVTVPLILFVWSFFFTDLFVVQAITVVDARPHTQSAAHDILEESIASAPFHRNIFFVDPTALEAAVRSRLPQVRTVHVTRQLPGTVKSIIQEKEPAFLLLSGGTYYFVDDAGIVYEEARLENLPGIVLPTVKNDDLAAAATIGTAAVERQFVTFIQQMNELLPDRVGAHLAKIHIPSLAAREIHVRLDNNWRILFDATRSADVQLSVLEVLLRETISAEEYAALEYIDLRIPNRVYYRTALGDGS
ncbi:MAG: hypothetical protein COT71_04090 [Candidatus Andersenbacteria bacterium CG10_big_fil_rev_8_21_14_0_10_54_11]|uniref:Uncharacterized protein n=1 Tax=Candidatus Andersenbacteria bacterium CG10_big_fil_rev_8_21_14_0_10_54_11 TaxID=1974485 RepID=A0A2M6WYI7_9BACT|nr:MAG: hypothetical protein COT71_04090 [Candidatus Andersenbacteria bacterium CG10_big_fil_rev_8_21_14_0_10_54_11]